MATPLKSATLSVVKNTLSPRTPNFLGIPTLSREYNQSPARKETSFRVSKSTKRLDFSPNISKDKRSSYLGVNNNVKFNLFIDVEKSREDSEVTRNIYINTPNKTDLMKNGLSYWKNKVDILGKGSFGTVVRGLYKENMVAVKIVEMKNNFCSDINGMHLSHPNVVKLLEMSMKPQEKYAVIIMEYLEGTKELQTILEMNVTLSDNLKLRYIEDVCEAVQYCHNHGILHLDIKPKNILVFQNQQCKICDFGNSCTTQNTDSYEFKGTVAYAAPELLKSMRPTTKCDIYSLGVTIWQIEYRRNPYEEWREAETIIYNVVKHNARPKYDPSDELLIQLFEHCWHQNSSSRPTIGEILEILETAK